MSENDSDSLPGFNTLSLSDEVLEALREVGYETPSPIQAETIPQVLAGRDVLAQAQTGTGKTAAFALPLLSKIHLNVNEPQVLVLTPTRELAIQVAEAFQRYASRMKGFHVLPIYGGQEYGIQMKQLKRGAHVIVGTPGRVMDHMRRGTLKLDFLRCLVLDEADEMLRMGFIDDVEWVLEQSPHGRQIALFSATLPDPIRRIAKKHLQSPAEITIKVRTTTAESIRQRYWLVSGLHKLDALTRILEAENFDGIIIFVRTKTMTTELAEKLTARGYSVAALSGDVAQKQRERTIERLKSGDLDIIVATDVAARGLDVDRISHVINYDIPHDTESYVHRIGRTGRFGRKGEAILFVAPREKHMLGIIERATRQKIELMDLPSAEMLNNKRIDQFTQRITDTLAAENLEFFQRLVEKYQSEHNLTALEIAAALARMAQGDTPLLLKEPPKSAAKPATGEHRKPGYGDRDRNRRDERPARDQRPHAPFAGSSDRGGDRPPKRPPREQRPSQLAVSEPQKPAVDRGGDRPLQRPPRESQPLRDLRPERTADRAAPVERRPALAETRKPAADHDGERATKRPPRSDFEPPKRTDRFEAPREKEFGGEKYSARERIPAPPPGEGRPRPGMERYRIDVGTRHGVKPGNIVGVVVEESGLSTRDIDQIAIHETYTTLDLPEGMPKQIYRDLKNVKVAGQRLNISRMPMERRPQREFDRRPDRPAGKPGQRDHKRPHAGGRKTDDRSAPRGKKPNDPSAPRSRRPEDRSAPRDRKPHDRPAPHGRKPHERSAPRGKRRDK